MARYINEADLVQAIIRERDKIPLTVPCAYYELNDVKPNSVGQSIRCGIRKALRCISEAPAADVALKSEVAQEIFAEIGVLIRRHLNDAGYIFGDFVYDVIELEKKYMEEQ